MRNQLAPSQARDYAFEPLFRAACWSEGREDTTSKMPSHRMLHRKAILALMATGLVAFSVILWGRKSTLPASVPVGREAPALKMPAMPVDSENAADDPLSCVVIRTGSNLHSLEDADHLAVRLKKQGVRRVWVQFKQDETHEFEGGAVFYPSGIAPVAEGFEDGRLMRFVENLDSSGIQVAAWLPAFHDPSAWEKHPDWHAKVVAEDGGVHEQSGWLCPRNPAAVAHESSLLAEVAELAGDRLAGIYTDFIRYDDDFSCVCDSCLGELTRRHGGGDLTAADIRKAAGAKSPLWKEWVTMRGDAIHDALDTMRDHLTQVDPEIWFGASVLPFSARDYSFNTQSGQDLAKMCRAGVDEIVLMGYWDDWEKSPRWLAECIETAQRKVEDNAKLSCLLDADMSLRRTMVTLDELDGLDCPLAWFNYGGWDDPVFSVLHRAQRLLKSAGGMPAPPFTAVTIRIDTEPDYQGSYDAVGPEMIGQLLDLFAEEKVSATFVTVGKLAGLQTEILRRAEREGHEIAGHGYDHEQIDHLSEDEQLRVIDRTVDAIRSAGLKLTGFGAPRNSITNAARDRLIERGFFYDGSLAYDPLTTYEDARLAAHTLKPEAGIVVVPFIVPNDWDARRIQKLGAPEMLAAWCERLDAVADADEPCFVLDVHQWLVTEPDNLEALRGFIRAAKARDDCRFLTLDATARHVLREIERLETTPLGK